LSSLGNNVIHAKLELHFARFGVLTGLL
jgi:hypothetical protein